MTLIKAFQKVLIGVFSFYHLIPKSGQSEVVIFK